MHSRGLETHYKAVIVSPVFAGLNAVKRHQKAYGSLGELMGQFHALALHTYTPRSGPRRAPHRIRPPARVAASTIIEAAGALMLFVGAVSTAKAGVAVIANEFAPTGLGASAASRLRPFHAAVRLRFC